MRKVPALSIISRYFILLPPWNFSNSAAAFKVLFCFIPWTITFFCVKISILTAIPVQKAQDYIL